MKAPFSCKKKRRNSKKISGRTNRQMNSGESKGPTSQLGGSKKSQARITLFLKETRIFARNTYLGGGSVLKDYKSSSSILIFTHLGSAKYENLVSRKWEGKLSRMPQLVDFLYFWVVQVPVSQTPGKKSTKIYLASKKIKMAATLSSL